MRASLTNATWLTPDRALAWCRVLAVGEAIWLVWLIVTTHGVVLTHSDFSCFWTAATFALQGHAASAYDNAAVAAFEHKMHFYADNGVAPFMYPPTFLLLCMPLALLPHDLAKLVFTLAGLIPLLICLRRIWPAQRRWLPFLAFPGLMLTAGCGQTSFLAAACFGGGMLLLDGSPFLAGMCLGLLACKPHLVLFVPIALLAAGRWRALAGVAASALGLIVLSWMVLGTHVWLQFPVQLLDARRLILNLFDYGQLQSLLGGAMILHAPFWLGAVSQAGFSLVMLGLLIHVVRRRPGGRAEGAMLAVATLAASPYLMDYDLVILALPLAWLAAEAGSRAWRPGEKYAAMAVYIFPLLTRGIATSFGVPLGPVVLAAFATVIVGRIGAGTAPVEAEQGVLAGI
jgi:alpha-1,2-mannosyltransferase